MSVAPSRLDAPRFRARVRSMERAGSGTVLVAVDDDGHSYQVSVGAVADPARARRWSSAVRRVHRVVGHCADGEIEWRVDTVGHRLPTTRRVGPEVALGLASRGVPLVLIADHLPTDGHPHPEAP